MTGDAPRDRHQVRRRTVRAPDNDWTDARHVLHTHGWELTEFLVTCLRAVVATPDTMLRSLTPYRTRPPRGRPKTDR